MTTEFNITKFLRWTIPLVFVIFFVFTGLLIFAIWPVSEFSIAKAGTFGDSFGVLTSLFTGLGFAGLLATVFQQREELLLNRRELEETRKEFQLQSQTFHRQRFEDAFYQMLALYKENLRDLSIRQHDDEANRIFGIDALHYLITKFEKAWGKHKLNKFPDDELERNEYLYVLSTTIQSVFGRQARYVETLSSILVLIDEECTPCDRKEMYWRILASQLTAYEIKYLFYQALITPDFQVLRNMIAQSPVLQDRLATLNILDSHRKTFEMIWDITLPKKRTPFTSPLSPDQLKAVRTRMKKRRMIGVGTIGVGVE